MPRQSHGSFLRALGVAVAVCLVVLAVLAGPFSAPTRAAVSAAGFVTGALAIVLSGSLAARRCQGRRRHAWVVLSSAAGVAFLGNAWTTLLGGDPVQDTSVAGDSLVALALVLSVFGLLGLSTNPMRGARLLVHWLDGIITGCAVLMITIALVLSRIVAAQDVAQQPHVLLFPILDVAVVTVALLQVTRHQGDRTFYSVIAVGFVLYAVADLTYAVRHAQDAYAVGTPHDVLWIAAYLLLATGAWHPAAVRPTPAPPAAESRFDVPGTILMFTLLIVAAVVQMWGTSGTTARTLTGLWIVLLLAVGLRQSLLIADNQGLRDGLEQRVREQTAHLQRVTRQTEVLLNSVGDGIYGLDLDGRITFANPSAAHALGYEPEELLGRDAHELVHAHAGRDGVKGHHASECYVTHAIAGLQLATGTDDDYRRADTTTFPVEVTASPLVDDDVVSGAVVTFRDVTQRREMERMKDEFLSIVSHELRTPLTSIRGSLGMLDSGVVVELPPRARRMVSIAVESSDRLTRLINDILDVERLRSGKLPMDLRVHDAAELLRTTATAMGPLAHAGGLRIEVGQAEGKVPADADRIVQTLTNIVGNAVKFSPPGSAVQLEAVAHPDEVTFIVRDEGRGIPLDKLRTIFEPFEQVDSTDARVKGGTGIGLAISRGIVERHGGRIWATSRPGRGTTVSFTLPHA